MSNKLENFYELTTALACIKPFQGLVMVRLASGDITGDIQTIECGQILYLYDGIFPGGYKPLYFNEELDKYLWHKEDSIWSIQDHFIDENTYKRNKKISKIKYQLIEHARGN